MLEITVPSREIWDEKSESFISTKERTLQLKHSLVSLSKWESKWNKSLISKISELSNEEILDYIRCMTINQNVDPNVYLCLTKENIEEIKAYIEAPMTATYFREDKTKGKNREIITSELIYYWMITLNIPFECQKWHLNRLLTLIKVCNIKNQPEKKMSRREILSRNAALNAARKKRLNTKG